MRRVFPEQSWPESWKQAYFYDLQEVWGQAGHRGYAYAYANRRRKTLDLVREAAPPGASVLDVAAAQGNFTLALAEAGYRVTWNDLRAELEGYVRAKRETGEVSYAPGNVFELGFESEFDCVLITEIIEHVAHPDEFLRKTARMVRPGGCVVLSTPNGAYFRNKLGRFSDCRDPAQFETVQFRPDADGHIFLLWPEEITELAARAGLALEKQELFTNPLTAGHLGLELLLKMLPRGFVEGVERAGQGLPWAVRRKVMTACAARFRK